MLNEEKIKLMTKLALYEQGEGKKALKTTKYFRNDYIAKNIINSILSGIFSYLLLLLVWVLFRVEYYTEKITELNIVLMVIVAAVLFVLYMIFYMTLSYFVFSTRYKSYRKGLSEYNEDLKNLHRMYKVESKVMEEKGLGGLD